LVVSRSAAKAGKARASLRRLSYPRLEILQVAYTKRAPLDAEESMNRYFSYVFPVIGFVVASMGSYSAQALTVAERCEIDWARATAKYARCLTRVQIEKVKKDLLEESEVAKPEIPTEDFEWNGTFKVDDLGVDYHFRTTCLSGIPFIFPFDIYSDIYVQPGRSDQFERWLRSMPSSKACSLFGTFPIGQK